MKQSTALNVDFDIQVVSDQKPLGSVTCVAGQFPSTQGDRTVGSCRVCIGGFINF